ncbi:MAG TPA: putative N-acetylmannosamine-6-phosphate 2-epimerase [Fimbriimonas sp.]
MTREQLLDLLNLCPLVASVQADAGTPCDDPPTLLRLARASLDQGVQILRLQGVENIREIKERTRRPVIGLVKRGYPDSAIYITPTSAEVDELLALGCEVVALDGTGRPRPTRESLIELIRRIHEGGALAMADCDTLASARYAEEAGADLVGTTLAGYTPDREATRGPDLDLLREIVRTVAVPVVAEGRYAQGWHVEAALRIGAAAVVVGGALNDPVKQTKALLPRSRSSKWAAKDGSNVGAVDIGGTWLRFGVFTPDWQIVSIDRTPNPKRREERLEWIRERIREAGVGKLGLGTGGITDPCTGVVWTAKEYLMPDQIGIEFSERTLGVPVYAHGDGHATAWGHACLPEFAGRRVATLTIGTGLGAGFVQDGRIWAGRRGEYPRINDLPTADGRTYEELLGGIHITKSPTEEQQELSVRALEGAIAAVRGLYFPDDIVVCGSVGLSPWLSPHLDRLGAVASPLGHDAGLYGAAALALFPSYV